MRANKASKIAGKPPAENRAEEGPIHLLAKALNRSPRQVRRYVARGMPESILEAARWMVANVAPRVRVIGPNFDLVDALERAEGDAYALDQALLILPGELRRAGLSAAARRRIVIAMTHAYANALRAKGRADAAKFAMLFRGTLTT